jgi:hypothetical protein
MIPTNPAEEIQSKSLRVNIRIAGVTSLIQDAKSQAPANINITKIHQELDLLASEIRDLKSTAAKYPAAARQVNASKSISTNLAFIGRIIMPSVKQLERRINPRDYEKLLRTTNELVKLATALTEFVKAARR